MMASAILAPEPPPKEPSPSGLLAKFARSPSRKHKPRPSSESIEAVVPVPASKPTRVRPRPGVQRTTTAPDAPVTLNGIKELPPKPGDAKAPTPPEGNMEISGFALADAVRPPTFKTLKRKDEVPDMPSLNSAQLVQNLAVSQQFGLQNNPNTLYQHIHDMSSKRISTLEYMRKAHEGRIFWFNTVQFSKSDVSRLPSYTPARLARRATNYLLLGMSIPTVLDIHPPPHPQNTSAMNGAIAHDYLRSLNALFTEFESFQQLHPTDGSSTSSLSRARIPQMFKRSSTRPRKSSGPVTEIGMPLQQSVSAPAMPEHPPSSSHGHQPSVDTTHTAPSFSSSSSTLAAPPSGPPPASFPTLSSFPPPAPFDAPNSSLIPNEGPYTHLLTPPLPFAPDFYTVFSTLCDVLIDAYQRLLQLLSGPNVCTPTLSESFAKVDARIRKVMVGGIIREFENTCRESAKRELMGVQKVVLGGLMGA